MIKRFTIPFAAQGDMQEIPNEMQTDGSVSFAQGFGYDYERDYEDPLAKDYPRLQTNALFNAITAAIGEVQKQGIATWTSDFAYPKGAMVYLDGEIYISNVKDNKSTPPENWSAITDIASGSLKQLANLSDLTDTKQARINLGLGTSAQLNETSVLGDASNLVATQKLVKDVDTNLRNLINALSGSSDGFLESSKNLSDLTNKSTARSNLGLGSAATSNITTSFGSSTSLVASQSLVNSAKNTADNAYSLASGKASKNTASKSSRGWWKCGSTGVMIQWGTNRVQGYSRISFPTSFSSAITSVVVTHSNGDAPRFHVIHDQNRSSFAVSSDSGVPLDINFIAIGY